MRKKAKQFVKKWNMLKQQDKIVLGVSGGADSVTLLLLLKELQKEYSLQLFAVHVNHGTRQEAVKDWEYVQWLCQSLEVPVYLFEADIPAMAKKYKKSEEEMGREYRYQCFQEILQQVDADKIAVGHHMDDQAETILFHLIRGSRMAGAQGMCPVNGIIIRPLLECRKEEMKQWLLQQKVTWKEDVTNEDVTYARNRIRNEIIPSMECINSQSVQHIVDFAKEMGEYRLFFEKMVEDYLREHFICQSFGGQINRERLLQETPMLVKAVLYQVLCTIGGSKSDIGSVHVDALYQLISNQSGKKLDLPYQMTAQVSYEMLEIRKDLNENFPETQIVNIPVLQLIEQEVPNWNCEPEKGKELKVTLYYRRYLDESAWLSLVNQAVHNKNYYTNFFECDTMRFALCIRNPKKDDYFVMNEMGSCKKLSRYFIDEKIPVERRKTQLVLAKDSNVLWVLGGRRSQAYKVSMDSQVIMQIQYKGEEL